MKRKEDRVFTFHHRGFIGEYRWDEAEQCYVCEYQNKTTGDYIFTCGFNRLGCMLNWIHCVNQHIAFLNGGDVPLSSIPF